MASTQTSEETVSKDETLTYQKPEDSQEQETDEQRADDVQKNLTEEADDPNLPQATGDDEDDGEEFRFRGKLTKSTNSGK